MNSSMPGGASHVLPRISLGKRRMLRVEIALQIQPQHCFARVSSDTSFGPTSCARPPVLRNHPFPAGPASTALCVRSLEQFPLLPTI